MIVGGAVRCVDGVQGTHLGSRIGVQTEIYCGIDFSVMQKLDWIRDRSMEVAAKLRQVEERLKKGSGETVGLITLQARLKAGMSKMNRVAMELLGALDRNEAAQVVARGIVYPGVYIEICRIPYVVKRELRHVRFSLNKAEGKIVVERLTS